MQPYPTFQNYGYGNNQYGYPQQPTVPYQDRLAQLQNQYNQTMPYNQPVVQQQQIPVLNGQMVGSLDEVKGKDVDLSGNPTWYPKVDGTEVYRKQLQPDGTSKILTYVLSNDGMQEQPKQMVDADVLNNLLGQLKQDLMAEISGIKIWSGHQCHYLPSLRKRRGEGIRNDESNADYADDERRRESTTDDYEYDATASRFKSCDEQRFADDGKRR